MSKPNQIVITITLISDDAVQINGPLTNKILCLGMLERAKDAVREFKPPIVIPALEMPTNGTHKEVV